MKSSNIEYQDIILIWIWRIVKTACSMENADLAITVSDLVFWWMGCVSLEQIVQYGKVEVRNGWVGKTVRSMVYA